jgi:hypothetical protein
MKEIEIKTAVVLSVACVYFTKDEQSCSSIDHHFISCCQEFTGVARTLLTGQ